jgi:hypothetical protein
MPWQGKITGLLFAVLETGSHSVAKGIPSCFSLPGAVITLPGKLVSFSVRKTVQKGVIGSTEEGGEENQLCFYLDHYR